MKKKGEIEWEEEEEEAKEPGGSGNGHHCVHFRNECQRRE